MLNCLGLDLFLLLLLILHLLLDLIKGFLKFFGCLLFFLLLLQSICLRIQFVLGVKILGGGVNYSMWLVSLRGVDDQCDIEVGLLVTRQSLVVLDSIDNLLHLGLRFSINGNVALGNELVA